MEATPGKATFPKGVYLAQGDPRISPDLADPLGCTAIKQPTQGKPWARLSCPFGARMVSLLVPKDNVLVIGLHEEGGHSISVAGLEICAPKGLENIAQGLPWEL